MANISPLPERKDSEHKEVKPIKKCFRCGNESWIGIGLSIQEYQEIEIKTVKTIYLCPACCSLIELTRKKALLRQGTTPAKNSGTTELMDHLNNPEKYKNKNKPPVV